MNTVTMTIRVRHLAILLSLACVALLLAIGGSSSPSLAATAAGSPTSGQQAASPSDVSCPDGQCFQDVTSNNTFFSFINALYMDNIIGGYACGGAGEPCVAPDNRPYYRPGADVTRAQMSKFLDNGRRNIEDAVGHSLTMTSTSNAYPVIGITATDATGINVQVAGNHSGVVANCTVATSGCNALYGAATTGNRTGYFLGGTGVASVTFDDNSAAIDAVSNGNTSFGASLSSQNYRGAYVNTNSTSSFSAYVDRPTGSSVVGLYVNGSATVANDLYVFGSKVGYVSDVMLNADSKPLEPGDVVTLVDTSASVMGQIPVITVQRASTAYDTGVVGIVDKAVYVPNAQVKAQYEAEQQAYKAAMDKRNQLEAAAAANGTKADLSQIVIPQLTITDEQGSIHSLDDSASIDTGSYVNVVTLGSYKGVKVDATSAPIHKGDLLVASTNPGYAMKATDRSLASGATIGKALADLESGTGIIPVMVTLK